MKNIFLYAFLVPFFYVYSYFLISNYYSGDQEYYRILYDNLAYSSLDEILPLALSIIGASEPLSIFLLWVGANLSLDKDVFISLWNVLLLIGLVAISRKHRMGFFFTILLVTNFYVIVLMTGAERLKFAFIFIVYFFLFFDKKISFFFAFLSPLAHFQILIFWAGGLLYFYAYPLLRFMKTLKIDIKTFAGLVVIFFLFVAFFLKFSDSLESKFNTYFSERSLSDLLNLLLLSVIVLIVSRRKFALFLMLSLISFFVLIVGGSRVNIIAFFLSLFFLIIERRANHPLFLLLMLYFSIKSVPFVKNILDYGNGFYHS